MAHQPTVGPQSFGTWARATKVGQAWRTFSQSQLHQEAMGMMGFGKYAGGFASKWLGRGFLGYSLYSGYKEGGILGAAKEGASFYAMNYALKAVGAAAPAFWGATLGTAAIAGAGYYAATGVSPFQTLARPAVREHMLRQEHLEMGRPMVDQFGNNATMRQRSLAAIQDSKINGRSALGNEATLMYRPYLR